MTAAPIFRRAPYVDFGRTHYAPGAAFHQVTRNRKLAPVGFVRYVGVGRKKLRPVAVGPFVSATYVSIKKTCPDSCAFKNGGCYVTAGFTGVAARALDFDARWKKTITVIENECDLIRGAFSRNGGLVPQDGGRDGQKGRDLRLHIGGDFGDADGADLLENAAFDWRQRGGGDVWSYTHLHGEIDAKVFRQISVLASVETLRDARKVIRRGWVPALVVPYFPTKTDLRRPYDAGLGDGWRLLACPAETKGTTCVECRACLNAPGLRAAKVAIGFQAHGGDKGFKARRALTVVR